jgi:7,8-dihydroneopterin aldolase/epimerase/oxygenase
MAKITIADLEVFYSVGVTDEERAKPQRLLLTIDMVYDSTSAALSDRVEKTINYHEIAQVLLNYGQGRSWKLLERLASTLVDLILVEYRPQSVMIEIKKFPIPQARYVAVSVTKTRPK